MAPPFSVFLEDVGKDLLETSPDSETSAALPADRRVFSTEGFRGYREALGTPLRQGHVHQGGEGQGGEESDQILAQSGVGDSVSACLIPEQNQVSVSMAGMHTDLPVVEEGVVNQGRGPASLLEGVRRGLVLPLPDPLAMMVACSWDSPNHLDCEVDLSHLK